MLCVEFFLQKMLTLFTLLSLLHLKLKQIKRILRLLIITKIKTRGLGFQRLGVGVSSRLARLFAG